MQVTIANLTCTWTTYLQVYMWCSLFMIWSSYPGLRSLFEMQLSTISEEGDGTKLPNYWGVRGVLKASTLKYFGLLGLECLINDCDHEDQKKYGVCFLHYGVRYEGGTHNNTEGLTNWHILCSRLDQNLGQKPAIGDNNTFTIKDKNEHLQHHYMRITNCLQLLLQQPCATLCVKFITKSQEQDVRDLVET